MQQRPHDSAPLVIEVAVHDGLRGLPIPVRRVRLVAFTTVQVCMHPRAVRARCRLRERVRATPVAMPLVPQRLQSGRETRGRIGLRQGMFETDDVHSVPPAPGGAAIVSLRAGSGC